MALSYNDLSDIRYNAFTGEYTPYRITNEEHTIPSTPPYIIILNESPQRTVPSTVEASIKSPALELVEKSKSTVPSESQFNVNYDELGNGQVRVNSAHAGKTLQISYNGLGSLIKKEILSQGSRRIIDGDVYGPVSYQEHIRSFTWDMVSDPFKQVTFLDVEAHNVIFVKVWIRKDTTTSILYDLETGASQNDTSRQGYINYATDVASGTQITMTRKQGGDFDDADFNDAGINRGFIYMLYRES